MTSLENQNDQIIMIDNRTNVSTHVPARSEYRGCNIPLGIMESLTITRGQQYDLLPRFLNRKIVPLDECVFVPKQQWVNKSRYLGKGRYSLNSVFETYVIMFDKKAIPERNNRFEYKCYFKPVFRNGWIFGDWNEFLYRHDEASFFPKMIKQFHTRILSSISFWWMNHHNSIKELIHILSNKYYDLYNWPIGYTEPVQEWGYSWTSAES